MLEENVQPKKKIIILDDDKFLLNMYATKFNNAGVEIETVSTGEDLIEMLKAGANPDLIILDVVIPGLSGLDTLEQLKNENLIKNAKVVMLTNQGEPEEVEKAKSLGIDGYIVKAMATPSEVVEKSFKIMNGS